MPAGFMTFIERAFCTFVFYLSMDVLQSRGKAFHREMVHYDWFKEPVLANNEPELSYFINQSINAQSWGW